MANILGWDTNPLATGLNLPDLTQKSPFSSPLASALQNFQNQPSSTYTPFGAYKGPQGVSAYQAKDMSGADLGFGAIRNRINANYSQAQDQAQDQLNRQFASMGGGPGGALAKQTENLATSMASKKDQDMQGADFQEQQQRQGLQQQESQKEYQSQENLKQSQVQQQFQDFQRQAGEYFQNYTQQQQLGLQKQGMIMDATSKLASLDQSWSEDQMNLAVQQFNAQVQAYTARHSGGIFGGGGFLGLGIGA